MPPFGNTKGWVTLSELFNSTACLSSGRSEPHLFGSDFVAYTRKPKVFAYLKIKLKLSAQSAEWPFGTLPNAGTYVFCSAYSNVLEETL